MCHSARSNCSGLLPHSPSVSSLAVRFRLPSLSFDMSDQFKWEGNVLRGPVKLLTDTKLILPRGPPESAPFNTGQWTLSLRKEGSGWSMHKYWSKESTRADDVVLEWKVFSKRLLPLPWRQTDEIGSILIHPNRLECSDPEPQHWNCHEHGAVDSVFRLQVICPSLQQHIVKPNVHDITSQIRSEHGLGPAQALD